MEEYGRLLGGRRGSVGAILEDGSDRFVRAGVEQQRPGAGGVDALLAIALDQPENADGRAEALFRMRPRAQDDVDQHLDIGTDPGSFGTNTLMGPVAITTMPKAPKTLAVILSPEEVLHFLGCVESLKASK